jgi:FG-GAP repeat
VYQRSGVSEWYAAGPLGIEQGFSLTQRPAGATTSLTVAVGFGGGLRARRSGSIVEFLTPSGRVALRYGGLSVTDRQGRALPATLSLRHGELLIGVRDAGARYPLRIDPFIQQGSKLTANDETRQGSFGCSVALSADGNTALIGAFEDSAAWVFTRSGSTWTQQGPELTPNPATGYFGASVALSADGNTAVIGADENGTGGGAWFFARSGSTWTQQGPEISSGGGETGFYAEFGSSVALSADGNTALISDPQDGATVTDSGAVWVFTRSGTTWSQQGSKLTPDDESGSGTFGSGVALSSDGDTALIGGAGDNSGVGAAWVFTRTGTTWTQDGSKLTASDESGAGGFGSSVALSTDDSTALIGGFLDNSGNGAAWVFSRSGTTWTQQGSKLTGSGETGHGYFGYSVALSSDGSNALIGGAFDNSQVGAVWAFTRSGTTWTQQGSKLTGSGESGEGTFGSGVALSSDGSTALIGGPGDNGDVGAAWAFQASAGAGGEPSNSGAVPTITGSPRAGKTITCSPGAWTGNPSFAYQYSDDGTPIQGATSATYKIQTIDEGLTLTCTVIASNASGSSKPVTSKGVLVPVPKVARCPAATGSLTATKLGQLALGMTRAQARHAYRKSSNRGRKYEDFFCLTPRGVRDGYGSPKEPKRYRDRVIWISTSSAYYAVHHIRVGATIPSAEKIVKLTDPYVVGKNTWYFTTNGGSNAIFKVRDNVIQEIGIADKALTTGKKAQKRFLTSFT